MSTIQFSSIILHPVNHRRLDYKALYPVRKKQNKNELTAVYETMTMKKHHSNPAQWMPATKHILGNTHAEKYINSCQLFFTLSTKIQLTLLDIYTQLKKKKLSKGSEEEVCFQLRLDSWHRPGEADLQWRWTPNECRTSVETFLGRLGFSVHNLQRGKKTRQTEGEVGRQHQGMDTSGVRQVPEGGGEQGKMEETGCEIICSAPTTLAVKG